MSVTMDFFSLFSTMFFYQSPIFPHRFTTNPTARRAAKAHTGALVGAGAAPAGAVGAGVPPITRVPEREPNRLHWTSTVTSPLLPLSCGRLWRYVNDDTSGWLVYDLSMSTVLPCLTITCFT